MAKESIEIQHFQAGIIANVSERDIPIDAASDSLNIDPNTESGSLIGINDDSSLSTVANPHTLGLINNDGSILAIEYCPINQADGEVNPAPWTYNTSYFDNPSAGSNKIVFTIDGTISGTDISSHEVEPNTDCCMEANNKEVHIGQGKGPSKWAGIIQHKQFGSDYSESPYNLIQFEDAEIKPTITMPDFSKTILIGSFLYGIVDKGNYVYKINPTTYVIEKSLKRFKSTQGISTMNGSTDYLWVYDAGETKYGTLYNYSVLMPDADQHKTTVTVPADAEDKWKTDEISDILHVTGDADKIWFYRAIQGEDIRGLLGGVTTVNIEEHAFVWSFTEPTSDGTSDLASKSPLLKNVVKSDAAAYASETDQGLWFGLDGDGMFYAEGLPFTHTNQDDDSTLIAATLDESIGYVSGAVVDDLTTGDNRNRFIADFIDYDPELNIVMVLFSDYKDVVTSSSGGPDKGYSYLNFFTVETDIESETYGELTWVSSHDVGVDLSLTLSATIYTMPGSVPANITSATMGPINVSAAIDKKNHIFFMSQGNFIQSYNYTNIHSLTTENPSSYTTADLNTPYHFSGNGEYGTETGSTVKVVVDENERFLFVLYSDSTFAGSQGTFKVFSYKENGQFNAYSDGGNPKNVTISKGRATCSAIDTENKLFFTIESSAFWGTRHVVAYKYDSLNFDDLARESMNTNFVIRTTNVVELSTANFTHGDFNARSSPYIITDPINRLLFCKFNVSAVTDVILASYNYDKDGNLTFSDEIKGSSGLITVNSPSDTEFAPAGISIPTYNDEFPSRTSEHTNIGIDPESKVVFPHYGQDILSLNYNADGTFRYDDNGATATDHDDILDTVYYKNRRVYKESLQHDDSASANKEGLGVWCVPILTGSDFGAQSKQGILAYGSNQGHLKTRAYGRNLNRVWMPKAGLIKPQGTDSHDCVAFPICFNNSPSAKYGNQIYYIGASAGSDIATNGDCTAASADGWTTPTGWTYNATDDDIDYNGSTDNAALDNTPDPTLKANVDYVVTFAISTAALELTIEGTDGSGNLLETFYSKKSYGVATHTIMISPSQETTRLRFKTGLAADNDASVFDTLTITEPQYVKSSAYWIMINDAIVPSAADAGATATLDGTKGECLPIFRSNDPGARKIHSVSTNANTNIKTCFTGSRVSDGETSSTLYVYDEASADTNPNFDLDNKLRQTPDAQLESIGIKSAAGMHSDTSADPRIELFESNNEGIGRWARVSYDRDPGEFDHPDTTNFSNTSGGILSNPILLEFELEEEEEGGGVKKDTKYFYRCSYLYDGYQEGPLGEEFVHTPSSDGNLKITIKLFSLSSLPKRVTHVNLYRSSTEDINASKPLGYYRLCKSLRLDADWKVDESDENINPNWGTHRKFDYLDEGVLFQSFESNAGYTSALENLDIRYSLNTQLNNTHFISNVSHPVLDSEGGNWLVKSLPYKFDVFDYTKDILRLPDKLSALTAFKGRIWGFTDNKMYVIEPNNLYIEDTSIGIGCIHSQSNIVTPYGMFWIDSNNIYWHTGSAIQPIGNAIKKGTDNTLDKLNLTTLTAANTSQIPIAAYDANAGCVLFIVAITASPNTRYAWSFHIATKRWECWEISAAHKVYQCPLAQNGYLYPTYNTRQYKYRGAGSKRTYNWESKEITLDKNTQYKHFHNIKIAGNNQDLSSKLTVKLDGSTVGESFITEGTEGLYKLPYGFRKGRRIKLEFSGLTSATESIDSIGITFRRKGAK